MDKNDARKLSAVTLTGLRKKAVLRVAAGESPADVARSLGVTKQAVYNWLSLFRDGGLDRLDARKRGGRPRSLDGKALSWIFDAVTGQDPGHFGFEAALWTGYLLAELVSQKFGVKLSRWSVTRLMTRLGFIANCPNSSARLNDPDTVEKRAKEQYLEMLRSARRNKAEILFGAVAGVRPDHFYGSARGVNAHDSVPSGSGAKPGWNMIAAMSPKGSTRFIVTQGAAGAREMTDFMKRLLSGAIRPVFLVLDRSHAHRAKELRRFAESTGGVLTLFIAPPQE